MQATDLLIDAPSKITLNQAQYNPVISGSGALEIKGSATSTELGIQPDATNGPLQYLIFSGSGTQTIRLNTSTPGGITAQTVRLVNGTKELISTTGTITGNLDILPTTTLRNSSSASKTLTVNGNVRNYGTVTNGTANTLTVKSPALSKIAAPGTTPPQNSTVPPPATSTAAFACWASRRSKTPWKSPRVPASADSLSVTVLHPRTSVSRESPGAAHRSDQHHLRGGRP